MDRSWYRAPRPGRDRVGQVDVSGAGRYRGSVSGCVVKDVSTPVGDAPVLPLVLLMTGGYLAWFGVHYWRDAKTVWPTDVVKAVLTGKGVPAPDRGPAVAASEDATPNPSSGQGPIASDALKYVGAGYVYGGNADAVGNWDCSSFVSYVLGHDLGLALPGGKWGGPGMPPHSHGPTTVSYLLYGVPINQADVAAGDLVVWQTHMGIATDSKTIVSARGKAEGVGSSSIEGTSSSLHEIPSFRRVPVNLVNPYRPGDSNATPPTKANPGGTIQGPQVLM